jgi:SpoVK/Ycf46/Vps4 family AAA+-type ATPase
LIILDETDAKLRNRANIEARGESVVNLNATTQFLETMQNVHNANYQVIFAGATNRVWDVDPAAKRPGRLGTMIYVPSPGLKDRFLLFRHYLKTVDNLKISPFGFFLLSLATSGYSSSEIEEICILAKKEMIYKNSNKAQLYTKEEYLRLKAENKLPHQSKENLSAKDVAKILKAPENRNSSLDIWYVESYKYMMGWSEIEKRTIKGKIFSKTSKEKVKHDGKLTGDERKVYKDMLKDIKRVHKHFWYIKLLRKTKWFIML